jgi:hypothetical protein
MFVFRLSRRNILNERPASIPIYERLSVPRKFVQTGDCFPSWEGNSTNIHTNRGQGFVGSPGHLCVGEDHIMWAEPVPIEGGPRLQSWFRHLVRSE